MSKSDCLDYLAHWIGVRSDGEWEHHNGIVLQTTDNPGWMIRITARGELPRKNEPTPVDVSTGSSQGFIDHECLVMFAEKLDYLLPDVVLLLESRGQSKAPM